MPHRFTHLLADFQYLPEAKRLERELVRLSDPTTLAERVRLTSQAQGVWRDIYHRGDEVLEVGAWHHNLIVNTLANLVAALLIGNGAGGLGATYAGVQYLAVGTNVTPGGYAGPETTTENAADTQLLAESYRQIVGNVYFSNTSGAAVGGTAPNLTVTTTIPAGQANVVLKEFGLFGGNATGTANSGLLIDRVTHGAIDKSSTGANDFDLTRTVTIIL